ncbi:MAG: hypothetical protein GX216_04610 [Methanomicrobiales archaeon]|nr:hypothetical protein [Methanomicrobiales archaeon]
MADFIEKTVNKTAVRDLATQIPSVEKFDDLIESVIDDNPFGCVEYVKNGVEMPAVCRHSEHYTAKVNFINAGKKVGTASLQSPTIAAFNANASAMLDNTAIATAMGGTAHRDPAKETYYCQLKCHDPSGDDYYVTFTRKTVRLSSYQDDSILDAIEEWADAVSELD